jgi:hypothetical protein
MTAIAADILAALKDAPRLMVKLQAQLEARMKKGAAR